MTNHDKASPALPLVIDQLRALAAANPTDHPRLHQLTATTHLYDTEAIAANTLDVLLANLDDQDYVQQWSTDILGLCIARGLITDFDFPMSVETMSVEKETYIDDHRFGPGALGAVAHVEIAILDPSDLTVHGLPAEQQAAHIAEITLAMVEYCQVGADHSDR